MKIFLAISLALAPGWLGVWCAFAGQASPTLTKAKQEAESRGYVFYSNRDEIVAKAKKEGKLRILVNMEVPTLKAAAKAFGQRYPFINLHSEEITGIEMVQRTVLEMKSGQAKDWDVMYASRDLYSEYPPYLVESGPSGYGRARSPANSAADYRPEKPGHRRLLQPSCGFFV